jgi:hypothetical protein
MSKIIGISAFNGIGCCRLALERAGIIIKPGDFYTSEINSDSIEINRFHHPDDIELGDICDIDGYQFRGLVNFLAGGSPCQSFSSAGIRNGFNGKSGLFFQWYRLKEEIQPEWWILENVWMKKEWQKIISDLLGVEPIFINSKVASGQSRPRLYWTNIPYTPIEDKGILLGDVVLGAVKGAGRHGKKNKTGVGVNWPQGPFEFQPDNKSYCIATGGGRYKNTQGHIKWFTAEDCEGLQTLPIGYTGVTGLPKTKRIEAIGNAWTVDVLTLAFFKNLPWASEKNMSLRLKYKIL